MSLLKRTYSLPDTTLKEFETAVASGERSAVIGRLLQDWLNQRERERLRREVIEGCHDMADVYLALEQEFHPLEEEIAHGLDPLSKPGRHRARSARSRGRLRTGR